MMNNKNNICCRVFKEQIELINQLPSNERAQVLYCAVLNAFNQFDYQNENQNENQNDCAYVSVSESVSDLGKCIINLLSKNIICKEFSNNYGGKRVGSGRKKSDEKRTQKRLVSDDWTPNEQTIYKLDQKGIDWKKATEKFILGCKSKGLKYSDFNSAILKWNWGNEVMKGKVFNGRC